MSKIYLTAPLPFQGQKRIFLKRFKEHLKRITNQITVIVDLFGGSGLLSHTAKRLCPWCEVIYNDFDDYHVRLEHIPETNTILGFVREKIKGLKPKQRIPDPIHDEICDYLERALVAYGYLDFRTLSACLLFANNYGDNLDFFRRELFWVRAPRANYTAEGYLDGINVVKKDYLILTKEVINSTGGVKMFCLLLIHRIWEPTLTATVIRVGQCRII